MHIISRKLEFDAGHRVYQHESKCNHIHGHRYTVELRVTAADLDDIGRVIDFSVLKSVCGKWIDDNLDHGMILYNEDPLAKYWMNGFVADPPAWGDKKVEQHKFYLMDSNPTAENLARMLFYKFDELLLHMPIRVWSVTVHETPNCQAYFKP